MTSRALLIGCPGGRLPDATTLVGVPRDLQLITDMLRARGFSDADITCPPPADNTRAVIIAHLRELIGATQPDDAVVLFLAGHGGLAEQDPKNPDPNAPASYTFFLTQDIDQSTEGDFRGITALELAALQHELTAITANVTTIVDACFSGRLIRDDGQPRAATRLAYADVAAHLASLNPAVIDLARQAPQGNARAVRLVAAREDEQAYEKNLGGGVAGVFTALLTSNLSKLLDSPLSWSDTMDVVRHSVSLVPGTSQRPEAEGPALRLPFTLDVVPPGAIRAEISGTRAAPRCRLHGGRISGVLPGDSYAIMPPGARGAGERQALALATVTVSRPADSDASIEWRTPDPVPSDALAFVLEKQLDRYPVRITGPEPQLTQVRDAVDTASHVRAAEDDEIPLAIVELTADRAAVTDTTGPITSRPLGPDLTDLVEDLNRLGRAQGFRLLPESPPAVIQQPFGVEVGLVGEQAAATPVQPIPVFAGQRIYLRFRNQGADLLFFHVFDINVAGRISLVTNTSPSGALVGAGRERVVGATETGELVGLELSWPQGIPDDRPRAESLMVLVTAELQNLRAVEQEGVAGGDRDPAATALQQWLDQLGRAVRRGGLRASPYRRDRYSVRRFDLLLFPIPPPRAETTQFAVAYLAGPEEILLGPVVNLDPVTVQLVDLRLADRPAGPAALPEPIRVDVLVLDGHDISGPDDAGWTASTTTLQPGATIAALPAFTGAVTRTLDLAVWASRDPDGSPSLGELLTAELATHPAAPPPAGPPLAVGDGELAVRAARASARSWLVDTAHRLLGVATQDLCACVRATWTGGQQFGAGRVPATGTTTAGPLSFAVRIDPSAPP